MAKLKKDSVMEPKTEEMSQLSAAARSKAIADQMKPVQVGSDLQERFERY
jgi:Tfp pilus assembly protein FimT